jgi:hypothetical protein
MLKSTGGIAMSSFKYLPPGKLRRAIIITCALALTAQGLAQAAVSFIHLVKEVLPFIRP